MLKVKVSKKDMEINELSKKLICKVWCYNLEPRDRSKEQPCIGLTQENSTEF